MGIGIIGLAGALAAAVAVPARVSAAAPISKPVFKVVLRLILFLLMISSSAHSLTEETRWRPCVAGGASLLDFQEQRIAITIDKGFNKTLGVAGCFALAPEFLPRARPIGDIAGCKRLFQRVFVHPRDHQDLAGLRILCNRGHKPSCIEANSSDECVRRDLFGHGHGGPSKP